jgi:uncharacterized delta-60 repeat protein
MERAQDPRTRNRPRLALKRRPVSGVVLVAAMVVGVVFSAGAQAAPGDLDLTFSGDGRQRTGGDLYAATGVALQDNGKIVVVGVGRGPNQSDDFALARYNPNGSLDTSFSGDGRQTTDFGEFDYASGVALQGDGKIVAVGLTSGDFGVARYNPNGSLDTSFSGDGRQTTDFGGLDGATGVALQGDGKIVVVGGAGGRFGDFALARYNPNGSLDTSFSGDGRQRTGGDLYEATGVALQDNGKIVVVGVGRGPNQTDDFALARYNPNGSLDTRFSGDGKLRTDFGGSDRANGVALQGDGKIVAVGVAPGPSQTSDFALARYNPNGSLDTSFSRDGRQRTDFGRFEGASGVALQGDGKFVAVGSASTGSLDDDFVLARYNPNGTRDTSFSGDGRQTTDFGGFEQASGVALQEDGKIVAVGFTGEGQTPQDNFALARYLGG